MRINSGGKAGFWGGGYRCNARQMTAIFYERIAERDEEKKYDIREKKK